MPRRIFSRTNPSHATPKLLQGIANTISSIALLVRREWLAYRREKVLSELNAHLQQDIGHSAAMACPNADEPAFNLQLLRNP